ncbi:MAG: uroporphyrinogen decarboxylase family protein [Armatimonadota bacterium]
MVESGMQDLAPTARLALDTIYQKPVRGIPSWFLNIMEHSIIERLAGVSPGEYARNPVEVYRRMQVAIGTCLMDQWIPENPLSMGVHGYEGASHGATTGAQDIVVDGMLINSPEAVVEHLESVVFPRLVSAIQKFNEESCVVEIIRRERAIQDILGPIMLKAPYGVISFPAFAYGTYGYVNYFSSYALYPDVVEKHFSLQADLAIKKNRAAARAIREANLPLLVRLDHDMADSRGTLVSIESLERIWFPHFARSIEPCLKAGIKMIWHCDGNLMEMVPRLLECGLVGFQGFQYEDGMDYQRICRMKTRDGGSLIIIAGVSVTRTLPLGTTADVKRELDWLVANGPETGLFLGASSSITPGTPWENIKTLIDGLAYYREYGRE